MSHYADTVYVNGRIYPLNQYGEIHEALAVKDGTIVFVGETKDANKMVGSFTEVIELNGKIILPAFADSHTHAPGLAYDILFNVNLYDALSYEETMDLITNFITQNPQLDIYYGRGFNACFFDGIEAIKGPRKEHLDKICKDKPIVLSDFGGNSFWMNSKAFAKYNITKDTKTPTDGAVEVDDQTGELWGILREGARVLVPYQTFTKEQNYTAAKWFQHIMNSFGYTSILAFRPPGTVEPRTTLFEMFKALEEKKELTVRVQGAKDMSIFQDIDAQLAEMIITKELYDSELIKFTTAKFFLDGAIESGTGFLLEPYGLAAGKGNDYRSSLLWNHEKLTYAFQRCMEEGFQIYCHTIGDGAVHAALDALEAAFKNMDLNQEEIQKYRNTLTHLQVVAEEDIKRMSKMNVIAGVQPYWHFKSPMLWWSLEYPLIGERAENQYPLASFLKEGIKIVASSDYPVTPEPNPFFAIQAGVTRNLYNAQSFNLEDIEDIDDPKFLLNKEERVSVYEMIKAFTLNAAYASYNEDNLGTIEIGKSADFIIVDQDPFEIEPLKIQNIKVLKTIFNGKIVYTSGEQ